MSDCCNLVSQLNIEFGCVISVSMNSSIEMFDMCATIKTGITTGSISITAYASESTYVGCPGQAGVSIPWIRRTDCNQLYFISNGEGPSYLVGGATSSSLVSLNTHVRSYTVLEASSSSGPTSLYTEDTRVDGYGLDYSGNPLSFDTLGDSGNIFENFGLGEGNMYLQNFSLNLTPGAVPTANYSFAYYII